MNKKPFLTSYRFIFALFASALVVYLLISVGDMRWGSFRLENEQSITVTGTAQKDEKNQSARFNASIYSLNEDKQKALDDVNTKMEKVITALKDFGIPSDNLKTTNLNVYQMEEPYLEDGVQKYKPMRWRANLSLEIKLTDISKSSELAELLAANDTSDIYGPNFYVDDSSNSDAELLASALEKARAKAETIAKASGKKLVGIIKVVEGVDSSGYPVYGFEKGMGGGGGLPLEPGTTELSKTVTVTYMIR